MQHFSLISIAGLFCFSLQAQTTVNIVASKDNTIYSESGSQSNGSGSYLFTGVNGTGSLRRSLIQFDLSSIPVGAVVTSVKLKLTCTRAGIGSGGLTVHKMTKDWGEGSSDAGGQEGGGASAQTNDATWTVPFFGKAGNWTSPGGDFNSSPSASEASVGEGDELSLETPDLIQDVQGWVNNSSVNFGWELLGSENTGRSSRRYNSRNNNFGRPTLTIIYNASLPVHLLSFKAIREKSSILLEWESADETNFKQYEIEHSRDASHFSKLQVVEGNSKGSYSGSHASPPEGNNFYRLRMVDKDGKSAFSKIVSAYVNAKGLTVVWPNPASQQIQVTTPDDFTPNSFIISDLSGRELKKERFSSSSIPVSQLPSGIYFIKLKSKDGRELTVRFARW